MTVTGLQPDTTYYYTSRKKWRAELSRQKFIRQEVLTTLKILYVGDPQIGASKGQPQGDGELVNDEGVANTAARK